MKTGAKHSDEARARMSTAQRTRPPRGPRSEATRAKLSAWRMGRPNEALKGRKFSAEHCAALSAVRKGIPKSAAFSAQVAATMTGKKFGPPSAATRAKISAANSGKPHYTPPEQLAKMRAGLMAARAAGLVTVPPAHRYSSLAQALQAHLSATGLTLEPEVQFGRFTVDLYDRAHHVAYEADGAYWHKLHEARHPGYDARRDEYLIQYYGLKVVHFTDKEIAALTGWPKKRKATA